MADKWTHGIKADSTDVTIYVMLRASATGLGKTGLVYTDMTGSYVRTLGSRTAISMNTLAAVTSAHTDGGFKEVDATNCPGLYRFDLPDAAFANGVDTVTLFLKASDMYEWALNVPITSEHPIIHATVVSDGSNTASTFKINLTSMVDNAVVPEFAYFTTGALKGQIQKVSGFVNSTDFVTVDSPFTGTPAAGDKLMFV